MTAPIIQAIAGLFDSVSGKIRGFIGRDGQEYGAPGYVLAASGVPVILVPSGTSNATGQITLGTALWLTPPGTAWVYLPAGVVVGDAVGGLRQAVFSSTTVCQLVGNPVTANGAYVQTTAVVDLVTVKVPGRSMGLNGVLRLTQLNTVPNNANSKVLQSRFGGLLMLFNAGYAATPFISGIGSLRNRNSLSAQIAVNTVSDSGSGTTSHTAGTVNTAVDQNLVLQAQLTVATDYIIIEGYTVEILASD